MLNVPKPIGSITDVCDAKVKTQGPAYKVGHLRVTFIIIVLRRPKLTCNRMTWPLPATLVDIGELLSTCSLPLEIGCTPFSKTFSINKPVCLEAHNYLLAHFWQILCSIFATSNIGLVVSIIHKIHSLQRILILIRSHPFVKYGHLHPEYAANLMASDEYNHCHRILLARSMILYNSFTLSVLKVNMQILQKTR